MRVNFASKRIEFTTGYRIDAAKWDADKQRVKNGCSNKLKQSASEINASLLEYYTEIQAIFKRFEVEDIMPTPEHIKKAFNALHKPASEEPNPKKEALSCDFFQVFDDFVEDCGRQNDWTDSTYEKFAAVKNHLTNFHEGLTFEFFDERGLNDYVGYLRDVKEMRNTTIGKQLSFLKWFLRWAFKKVCIKTTPTIVISPNSRVPKRKSSFSLGTNSIVSESSKSLPTSRLSNVCVMYFFSNASRVCVIPTCSIFAEVI